MIKYIILIVMACSAQAQIINLPSIAPCQLPGPVSWEMKPKDLIALVDSWEVSGKIDSGSVKKSTDKQSVATFTSVRYTTSIYTFNFLFVDDSLTMFVATIIFRDPKDSQEVYLSMSHLFAMRFASTEEETADRKILVSRCGDSNIKCDIRKRDYGIFLCLQKDK